MSVRWESAQLLQPITEEQPCGENLEDTRTAGVFRCLSAVRPSRGRSTPRRSRMKSEYRSRPTRRNGSTIRDKALEALAKSKDLRLLAHLGTALLEDRRRAGVFRDAARGVSMAGNVLEPDLSARRRGCRAPAQRAELFRRSDGGRRRAAPRAAGPQPSARHVQPSRHRHRDASAGRRPTATRRRTKTRSRRPSRRCRWPSSRSCRRAWSSAVASLEQDRREHARCRGLRGDARRSTGLTAQLRG